MSLAGIRALVTRPAAQADGLIAALRAEGALAWGYPLLEIGAIDATDPGLHEDIKAASAALDAGAIAIFVSSNAVRFALPLLRASTGNLAPGLLVCAVGRATLDALRDAGVAAIGGSSGMDSEELLALPQLAEVAGRDIVIFKGEGGRQQLAEVLRGRGARVTECVVYRRHAPTAATGNLARLLDGEAINTLLISSGEALANLFGLLDATMAGRMKTDITVVVPSERIATQARAAGIGRLRVAANATDAAMIDALR